MIYVARMHTSYPDFHGEGYYNFLMSADEDVVNEKIEDNSHDYHLDGDVKEFEFDSIDDLLKKYPTKQDLNEAFD